MKITLLTTTAKAPYRATPGSAGYDLHADTSMLIYGGQTALIKTGVSVSLDPSTVGAVCSRSGLALKDSVFVLNAPGIIDQDYTGDIGVVLHNAGINPFQVTHGDRIAQLVILRVEKPLLDIVDSLEATQRGDGGFGHTGI